MDCKKSKLKYLLFYKLSTFQILLLLIYYPAEQILKRPTKHEKYILFQLVILRLIVECFLYNM